MTPAAVSLFIVPIVCLLTVKIILVKFAALLNDTLSETVLERTRKIIIVIWSHFSRGRRPSTRMKNIVDIVIIASSVAIPSLRAVIQMGHIFSLHSLIVGYVRGCLYLAVALALVKYIGETFLASSADMGATASLLENAPTDWKLGCSIWEVGPEDWGGMHSVSSMASTSTDGAHRVWNALRSKRRALILWVLLVFLLALNMGITFIHKNGRVGIVFFVAICVVIRLLLLAFVRHGDVLFDLVAAGALFCAVAFFLAASQQQLVPHGGMYLGGGMNYTPVQRSHIEYPICNTRWGHASLPEEQRLTVLDLLNLVAIQYGRDSTTIIDRALDGTEGTALADVQVLDIEPFRQVGRMAVFRFPTIKAQVLVVRGTQTNLDMLKDLDLYTMSALLQLMDTIVPVLSLFTEDELQWMMYYLSVYHFLGDPVVQRIVNNLRSLKEEGDSLGFMTIATGHSLGGALAVAAAARANTPALVFSAPGYVFIAKYFGIDLTRARNNVINILPENDVLGLIDSHVGAAQEIACTGSAKVCHQYSTTMCELLSNCGDPRSRTPREKACPD